MQRQNGDKDERNIFVYEYTGEETENGGCNSRANGGGTEGAGGWVVEDTDRIKEHHLSSEIPHPAQNIPVKYSISRFTTLPFTRFDYFKKNKHTCIAQGKKYKAVFSLYHICVLDVYCSHVSFRFTLFSYLPQKC